MSPRRGTPPTVQVHPLADLPEVLGGADLAALVARSARERLPGGLRAGDVVVVSSKLVSKALGLRVAWDGDRAVRERVVAAETVRVVAERRTATGTTRVVESAAGPVMAAAGVDASNTGGAGGLLLLPRDADAAAEDLRERLRALLPGRPALGVVLSDTAGRPWRGGQTDLALGAAGLEVVDDLRGGSDHDGRALAVTTRALADEVAAAADLVKGKADGVGAAVVRGLGAAVTDGPGAGARALVRTGAGDWFALGHVEAVRAALGVAPGSPRAAAVGVPAAAPEALPERAARAARLALVGLERARLEPLAPSGRDQVAVPAPAPSAWVAEASAPDRLDLGRLLARLEVAAASEGLGCTWTPAAHDPARARVSLAAR